MPSAIPNGISGVSASVVISKKSEWRPFETRNIGIRHWWGALNGMGVGLRGRLRFGHKVGKTVG